MDFVRENAKNADVHDRLFVETSDTAGILDYLKANGLAWECLSVLDIILPVD